MSTKLLEKVAAIPKEKEKELEAFLDSILAEQKKKSEVKVEKPEPKFGALKGMFIMADDFDEPLEDFKEHM